MEMAKRQGKLLSCCYRLSNRIGTRRVQRKCSVVLVRFHRHEAKEALQKCREQAQMREAAERVARHIR